MSAITKKAVAGNIAAMKKAEKCLVKMGFEPALTAVKEGYSLNKPSRTLSAHVVMHRMKSASRKDTIAALVDEVGLTTAGAATYYHNLR